MMREVVRFSAGAWQSAVLEPVLVGGMWTVEVWRDGDVRTRVTELYWSRRAAEEAAERLVVQFAEEEEAEGVKC